MSTKKECTLPGFLTCDPGGETKFWFCGKRPDYCQDEEWHCLENCEFLGRCDQESYWFHAACPGARKLLPRMKGGPRSIIEGEFVFRRTFTH